MKRIETKEILHKKSRRNQFIVGIILVVMMIFGTAGYSYELFMSNDKASSNEAIKTFSGITMYKQSGYWRFNYGDTEMSTEFNPEEVKDVDIVMDMQLMNYYQKPLYFATESGEPNIEILKNINSKILRYGGACSSEDCKLNLPLKNCLLDNVIIIKEPIGSEKERVYQEARCVYIIAKSSNQTRLADAFLFNILGIENG